MESVQLRLQDRISNLPDNITKIILMKLPTRDAVRTSILSRKWRHVKDKLSQFVIDKNVWKNVATQTLGKVLYQLLLGYDGPINKFKLSYTERGSCTEVDNLISFLCKRHNQDFSLEMYLYDVDLPYLKESYLVPISILSCPTLRHLELKSCSIRSFASVGLRMLTTLKLFLVSISAETLASLISGSPLITILEISSGVEFDICIDAPNLTTLTIIGYTSGSIKFKRVPVLASVSIKITDEYGDVTYGFFDSLFALETLRLSFQAVKKIRFGIRKKLPTTLPNLKDLRLSSIGLSTMDDLRSTLCLLRRSPNIKYFDIDLEDVIYEKEEERVVAYMEGEDFSSICLSELSEVKMSGLTGTVMELKFIRLLLSKSSSLKKIQIQPQVCDAEKLEILQEISTFPRKSNEAQVMFGNQSFERDRFLEFDYL